MSVRGLSAVWVVVSFHQVFEAVLVVTLVVNERLELLLEHGVVVLQFHLGVAFDLDRGTHRWVLGLLEKLLF